MPRLSEFIKEDTRRALSAIEDSRADRRAARRARRMIRSRTAQGVDRHGRQFAPYAPSTAKKKGRFSPVTLRETGKMLRSLSIRDLGPQNARRAPSGRGSQLRGPSGRFVSEENVVFGSTINIKGSRNRRIARFHIEGTRKMPERDFLGLTDQQESRLTGQFGRDIANAISRAIPDDRRRRIEIEFTL